MNHPVYVKNLNFHFMESAVIIILSLVTVLELEIKILLNIIIKHQIF